MIKIDTKKMDDAEQVYAVKESDMMDICLLMEPMFLEYQGNIKKYEEAVLNSEEYATMVELGEGEDSYGLIFVAYDMLHEYYDKGE